MQTPWNPKVSGKVMHYQIFFSKEKQQKMSHILPKSTPTTNTSLSYNRKVKKKDVLQFGTEEVAQSYSRIQTSAI